MQLDGLSSIVDVLGYEWFQISATLATSRILESDKKAQRRDDLARSK